MATAGSKLFSTSACCIPRIDTPTVPFPRIGLITRLGDIPVISSMVREKDFSIALASMADIEMATSCMLSSRFCAVTTISSICVVVDLSA